LVVDAAERVGAALATALPAHARRRGVVVLVHGRGPASPWRPADRTLAGIVASCIDAGISAAWAPLGRAPDGPPGVLSPLAAPSHDRRALTVQLAGSRCTPPLAWIGRHAVLVSPAVIGPAGGRDGGPLGAALAALAMAACARGDGDPTAIGAALLAQVFAGFTWVLDARAALLRPRDHHGVPHSSAPGRVFVHGATGLDPAEVLARAHTLDRWCGAPDAAAGIAPCGPLAADPWPVVPASPVGVDGPTWSLRPRVRDRKARRP